ncbi:uncharacterized protein AB675_4484 [Cyphellophora attinorum]|uniref:Oxidoreductase-like domain-containing protein n=1 Tax=Cyphellophora attinorum TaxID=1664694 RepID=A0A0N1H855_9EURO|nr:uncharacterized protein AB675_4484 [Phialophora attinorum]KPI39147.1 hypothetical protein AB675_4484 [Phialophora attinorum]
MKALDDLHFTSSSQCHMDVLTRVPRRPSVLSEVCRACLCIDVARGPVSQPPAASRWRQQLLNGVIQQRYYQSSERLANSRPPQLRARPLGDFYSDLLAVPIPKDSTAHSDLPTFVQSGDETKEARAAKLFGNIRGSGYERKLPKQADSVWKTINGVPIPPRPEEPENCCMSGCMHCVWDDYRDDIEEWAVRLREAQAKGAGHSQLSTPKIDLHRPEVVNASVSMDDDGGGSEALWDAPSVAGGEDAEELFAGIPVGIREFMATEKRLRERKKARKAKS